MKKTIPREKQKHVVVFDVAEGTIAATGNIAVHFNKGVADNDMSDVVQVPGRSDQDDSIWEEIREDMTRGLVAKAHVAVVIPVDRLLEVLSAVDTKLIKLEFLPTLIPCDEKQCDLVYGEKYIQSMRHVGGVDAMRVTEITSPDKHDEAGDSVCVMGVLRVVTEWFQDMTKVNVGKGKRQELFKRLKARAKRRNEK